MERQDCVLLNLRKTFSNDECVVISGSPWDRDKPYVGGFISGHDVPFYLLVGQGDSWLFNVLAQRKGQNDEDAIACPGYDQFAKHETKSVTMSKCTGLTFKSNKIDRMRII